MAEKEKKNFIELEIDKDLESGKWVKIEGWTGVKDAKDEILSSVERYKNAPQKPNF